jgi:riboflavin kinase/FMN adenylyltransferase
MMTYLVDFEPAVLDASRTRRDACIMQLYEGLDALPTLFARSTVTIGAFDGVHRGHQALIRRTVADARAHGRPAVVLTFDRHPMELRSPESAPQRLTTPAQRNALIAELGVDCLIIARFDRALAEMSPDEFTSEILKGALGMEAIVEGVDFCFGKNRTGDLAYLHSMQGRYGFTLHTLKPVLTDGGLPISSTRIRGSLRAGEITAAEAMLGHEFRLVGRAISGQSSHPGAGYATVQLEFTYRQAAPSTGSYAALARLDNGREMSGVCAIRAETNRGMLIHLPDFDADLGGRELGLRLFRRVSARKKCNQKSYDSLLWPAEVRDAA